MIFESITNRGEFFSNHYLDAIIAGDLSGLRSTWKEIEEHGETTARSRIAGMAQPFFKARAAASEATRTGRAAALADMHDVVLAALGFEPDRTTWELKRNTEHLVSVPVAAHVETSTGLLLVAIEAGLADSADELLAYDEALLHDVDQPGELLEPLFRSDDKRAVHAAADAVGEIFSTDEPPRYVLVLGGNVVLLAERAKWAEGRYLAVDLATALERNDTKAKGELETIAALFSADVIVPEALEGQTGQSLLEELVDNSHKHAVGVSKELRNGIRESIELLANEVIAQLDNQARARNQQLYSRSDVDATLLTRQCLRYLFRLLVLLYAESRPELGILPADDAAYVEGYSLDRLRELCLMELGDDRARNGSHLHQSLDLLFELVNDGYHAEQAEQQLLLHDHVDAEGAERSAEDYLQFPGLHAELFDPESTSLLNKVTLRNEALQQVLKKLMLAPGRRARDAAGFISYAQLGINQLGAVYEGLMAYNGFFAERDLYEVAKGGDPSDGTWMLPVDDAEEYPDDVFVTRTDEVTGEPVRILHEKNSFVFRLSGRDRQRSASYYTPEVLTRCVVKHALAELLGTDDYAREPCGSAGIAEAVEILDLTICEPALGSGAFLNEAINQLSTEYLKRRQAELNETLDADRYQRELQKVKAHFALHQSYGVDLNATAVELAEVSLWLNCMYPGLKAPWFGLQLRRGNSLIGCRRATWRVSQLGDRPWAETRKGKVQPPVDRKLSDGPLDTDEIHHFLLPGHGWAAVAGRKEAKELREVETMQLRAWSKAIQKAPKETDAARLTALAAGVERLWASAGEWIAGIQARLRRSIDVYGWEQAKSPAWSLSRAEAQDLLADPDSPPGRLRTLMDAWVGLWLWPLDTGESPPTWGEWLQVAEALIRPEASPAPLGQLDLLDHQAMIDAAEQAKAGQVPLAELQQEHAWLGVALDAAHQDGAWHWDLEFAPVFRRGGFDLQVGNPPWVRPRWYEDLVLAEFDPWWGVTDKAPDAVRKRRRAIDLAEPVCASGYLAELASAEGVVESLGSAVFRPVLAGVQTNLYMVFMDTIWRHMAGTGAAGLLHPESHFTDPKASQLRRAAYGHLRRVFRFANGLFLFEEIAGVSYFTLQIYGPPRSTHFRQVAALQHPDTADLSMVHSGDGPMPGIQYPTGGWDLRPHRARVLTITEEVLADWARLFDEPGTPAVEARLLRPVTTADLEALSVLADQTDRLADHEYHWTAGWHEKGAKTDGTIRWETAVPDSWDEVILQGPHFSVATPFAKQPNANCANPLDYSEWDLDRLPDRVIPRTNYKRACESEDYGARLDVWDGQPSASRWRHVWRRMTQPGLERSLQGALLPAGPTHVNTCFSLALGKTRGTALFSGLWSTLPFDYLVKVSGKGDVQDQLIYRSPTPFDSPLDSPLLLRTLRLNCLTADYAPLWEELFEPAWQQDRWTDPDFDRVVLGDVEPTWSMATPLRRDQERRMALVELDALAAPMLGLTAEQLCAMYRSQFAVLRKYEYKMAFDSEGRKLCGYHQSAGYRQAQLQDRAKTGDLPADWKNVWKLYEQYEEEPESVDWLGHYTPPFTRADRELEMTGAYEEFQRRLDAGEYETN